MDQSLGAVYESRGGRPIIYIYLSLHCHHQNDSCIKMGSDESHFNVSLIVRDGEKGVWRWGRGRLYTYRYTVTHQNDFCIKMGSDESHFNVSLIVTDKVTRQCPETAIFEERERRAEADSNRGPSAHQPNALPLGQTGSRRESGLFVPYTK